MFFETKNLCFSYYKSAMILKDISFAVSKNSKTLILASKEMGKTTILKVLSGFEDSRFGNIYLNGKELKQIDDKDKNFSLVLSDPVLFENKTIKDNLNYQCEVCEKELLFDEQIKDLLCEFDIKREFSIKVKKLPLFEKRKLQIVRALIKQPQILFLDDQFEGLNDDELKKMNEIYLKISNKTDLTLIYALGDEIFKRLNKLNLEIKNNMVLYLNMANLIQFKQINDFKSSFISLDVLKFLECNNTENCYIEKDNNQFWLCFGDERLFKFDSKFNKKLGELKLEFGDIEDCEILILGEFTLAGIDANKFNKCLDENLIFIYSSLTGNLII